MNCQKLNIFLSEKNLQDSINLPKTKSSAILKTEETLANKYYKKQIESID